MIVTSGAQQAFDLAAHVLVAPGDVIAVEELRLSAGSSPVREPWRNGRRRALSTNRASSCASQPARAKLVYTTPSHQFPTGVRTSLGRRLELARAEATTGGDYRGRLRQRVPLRRRRSRSPAESGSCRSSALTPVRFRRPFARAANRIFVAPGSLNAAPRCGEAAERLAHRYGHAGRAGSPARRRRIRRPRAQSQSCLHRSTGKNHRRSRA